MVCSDKSLCQINTNLYRMYVQIHPFARLNISKIMKFDSGSLWYLENENPSTTESWTDENFDLKNPRYERKKKSTILHLDPFARLGPSYLSTFHISICMLFFRYSICVLTVINFQSCLMQCHLFYSFYN